MTKPKPNLIPKGWLTITQAAHASGNSYQVTRDAMLSGKCGPTQWIGRRLIATANGVATWRDARARRTGQ